jgi:hypothetical protein
MFAGAGPQTLGFYAGPIESRHGQRLLDEHVLFGAARDRAKPHVI